MLPQSSVVKACLSPTYKVAYSMFATLQNCQDHFFQQHIEHYRIMLIPPTVGCGSTHLCIASGQEVGAAVGFRNRPARLPQKGSRARSHAIPAGNNNSANRRQTNRSGLSLASLKRRASQEDNHRGPAGGSPPGQVVIENRRFTLLRNLFFEKLNDAIPPGQ